MKRILLLAVCLAAVSFGACSNESKFPVATGKASVRAINTIPTSPTFGFLIEERLIGSVDYKSASAPARYDDLEYSFSFEVVLAGDLASTRIASELLDVERDKDYTFIISGAIAAPVITLWESDERTFDITDTVFEARFGHTAESLGDVEVYFADASVPPVLGAELGTLTFGEFIPAADFEAGEYVLTITASGDPLTVHFVSNPVTFTEQTAILISVFDGDANDLSPWAVRFFNQAAGGAGALLDSRFQPTIRLFHTSLGIGTTDIYTDDPLTTPFIAGHAFGDFTGDVEVPAGDLPLTYTAVDNIGSILVDTDRIIFAGTRSHYYLIKNSADADVLVDHRPDRRSIETIVKLSIINTAASHTGLDVYAVARGELIDEALPLFIGLPLGADPIPLRIAPGSYDIYVTVLREKTVLAGPIPLDVALGDVVDAIIYENVSPDVVDFVLIPVP